MFPMAVARWSPRRTLGWTADREPLPERLVMPAPAQLSFSTFIHIWPGLDRYVILHMLHIWKLVLREKSDKKLWSSRETLQDVSQMNRVEKHGRRMNKARSRFDIQSRNYIISAPWSAPATGWWSSTQNVSTKFLLISKPTLILVI